MALHEAARRDAQAQRPQGLIEGNAVFDAVLARELVRREGLARAQDVLELVDEGLLAGADDEEQRRPVLDGAVGEAGLLLQNPALEHEVALRERHEGLLRDAALGRRDGAGGLERDVDVVHLLIGLAQGANDDGDDDFEQRAAQAGLLRRLLGLLLEVTRVLGGGERVRGGGEALVLAAVAEEDVAEGRGGRRRRALGGAPEGDLRLHEAALADEALLTPEEVLELLAAAPEGVQGLADSEAVLVGVDQRELLRRDALSLDERGELLGEARLGRPQAQHEGVLILHAGGGEMVGVAEHGVVQQKFLLCDRNGRGDVDALLQREDGVLRCHGDVQGAAESRLGLAQVHDAHLHLHDDGSVDFNK
mmetsp:Transcript_28962/g.63709  ORF Transcript_28962/g.63709 Transcript_28962/m.63709 type:complete len:363 (-) Transcript_28962:149-1237(-)